MKLSIEFPGQLAFIPGYLAKWHEYNIVILFYTENDLYHGIKLASTLQWEVFEGLSVGSGDRLPGSVFSHPLTLCINSPSANEDKGRNYCIPV